MLTTLDCLLLNGDMERSGAPLHPPSSFESQRDQPLPAFAESISEHLGFIETDIEMGFLGYRRTAKSTRKLTQHKTLPLKQSSAYIVSRMTSLLSMLGGDEGYGVVGDEPVCKSIGMSVIWGNP